MSEEINGTIYNPVTCNCDCDCDCNGSGNSNSGNNSGNGSDTTSGSNNSSSTSGGTPSGNGTDTNSGSNSNNTNPTSIPSSLSNFTNAEDARNEATSWTTINSEIQAIETMITAAITAGKFQIFVSGTYMTSQPTGLPYFRVYYDEDEWLNTPYDQMNIHHQIREVKMNFTNLDYDFEIVQNPNLPNTLMFIISW